LTNCRSISGHEETSSLVTDRAGASGSDRNVMKPLILVDIFRPFLRREVIFLVR
jgi:hypothetical protein